MAAGDIAFVRYATTGLILAPWTVSHFRTIKAVGWQRGLTLAALGGPLFVMVSSCGYLFAPLAHAAVVQLGTAILVCTLFGVVLLREQLGNKGLGGLAVLIAGLAIVAGPGLFSGSVSTPIGDGLFVLAGAMWAAFTLFLRRWKIEARAATIAISVLSAVLYCPAYLVIAGTTHLAAVPAAVVVEQALVQGILVGLVALFAYGRAVHLLGAARAAVFSAFAPIASILIGIVLVHEIPTPGQWLGLAVASAGMVAIVKS
jgi:drug/metabolite transporter (DMT)-like permease